MLVASGLPLTVALIDVGNVEAVKEAYLHRLGDQVLWAVAAVLIVSVRCVDR